MHIFQNRTDIAASVPQRYLNSFESHKVDTLVYSSIDSQQNKQQQHLLYDIVTCTTGMQLR